MQGIYTYIPETNHVPREYSVSARLSLLFMVPISLVYYYYYYYYYYCCCFCYSVWYPNSDVVVK